ncbi:MAG: M15 family metallopeptidase [Bacilli bacterium]|nr:M15 family metallopeptidase [Bacilli bacterium]
MSNLKKFIKKYDMKILNDKIDINLKYATDDNFLKQKVYTNSICLLRKEVAEKILEANKYLKSQYQLKLCILDAYRPIDVQRQMFNIINDPKYVADPDGDKCNHVRGNAVDVCLIDFNNHYLEMPSSFDTFGEVSSRDYYRNNPNINHTVQKNALLLEQIMQKFCFIGLETEWWHFDYYKQYPVIKKDS